jgi:plastocyanin
MLRLLSIGGACLAFAGALAGCGGSSNSNSGSGGSASSTSTSTQPATTPTTKTQTSASSSPSGKKIVVKMVGFAFKPAKVTGKVGQTVEWINEDDAPHNAVAQNGGDLKTATVMKGGTVSYKLDSPGTIKYICTVHPNMHGTLVVKKK